MKILVTMAGENTWEDLNLRQTLQDMGHEVIETSVESSVSLASKHKPDLYYMVSAGPHEGCDNSVVVDWKDTMHELKIMKIPTVYFSAGAGCGFVQMDALSAPHVVYAVTTDRESIDYFKNAGTPNVIYSCFATNPDVYKKMNLAHKYDVSFVGTAFGHRGDSTIPMLLDNDVNVRVWGDFWRDDERPGYIADSRVDSIAGSKVPITHMVQLFNETKINLCFSVGFHIDHYRGYEPRTMKLRHFEITASGGFMMTDWSSSGVGYYELDEFFKPGVECEVYSSDMELVDKTKYYLEHEDERNKIAQAGYERCINDHTWSKRFNDIFLQMGVG